MMAHIVGGGFGGLAAAAYLVRDAGMFGQDVTVYEADDRLGGAFSLAGDVATGYILPTGAVFDAEFRCTFDLLATIPSVGDPAISVMDDFFAFNTTATIAIETAASCMGGISAWYARPARSCAARADARRAAHRQVLRADFFATEFWLLWTRSWGRCRSTVRWRCGVT